MPEEKESSQDYKKELENILNKDLSFIGKHLPFIKRFVYPIILIIIITIDMMVFCKYQTWSAPVIIFILQFFFLLSISKVLKVPNDMDDFLTKVLIAFSKNLPIDKESGTKKQIK